MIGDERAACIIPRSAETFFAYKSIIILGVFAIRAFADPGRGFVDGSPETVC